MASTEKFILRTFKVPEEIEVRLSARANGLGMAKADLARAYLDKLLQRPKSSAPTLEELDPDDRLLLRTYYLSPQQDTDLHDLAKRLSAKGPHVSKAHLFRSALIQGLGRAKKPRAVSSQKVSVETRKRVAMPAKSSRASIGAEALAAAMRVVIDAQTAGLVGAAAVAIFSQLASRRRMSQRDLSQQTSAKLADVKASVGFLESKGLVSREDGDVVLTLH